MVDAGARNVPEVEDAMNYPLFSETLISGKGCQCESGFGDGIYPVHVVSEGGRTSRIEAIFRDEADCAEFLTTVDDRLEVLRNPESAPGGRLTVALGELIELRRSTFRPQKRSAEELRRELSNAFRVKPERVPEDLLAWFTAHDGQTGIGKWFPGVQGRAGSLDEMLELRHKLLFKPELGASLSDRRDWLPLISIGPSVHRTTCQIFDGGGLVTRRSDDIAVYNEARRRPVPLLTAVTQALDAWRAKGT
jgi:hypothetical protein